MADTSPVIEMEIQSGSRTINMSLENSSSAQNRIIDDNAGAGVTDKTWSANKLTQEFNSIGTATQITGNMYRLAL